MECCALRGYTHQNRTIAIASDFRIDGAKSPEIPQNEGILGSEIAARNRKSLATFHRTLNRNGESLSLVSEIAAISWVRDGHRNRKNCKNRCDFGALRGTNKAYSDRLIRQNPFTSVWPY